MRARAHWPGLFTLLLLSPIVAELLSGSAPPAEFFSPASTSLTLLWTAAVAAGLLAFAYRRLRTSDPAALISGGTLAAGVLFF